MTTARPRRYQSPMNESCEVWSLPWHVLQRNLARNLGAVEMRGTAFAAGSWLRRPRQRVVTPVLV